MSDSNALKAREKLISIFNMMCPDSEDDFFTVVSHEVENFSGDILNRTPGVFDGGWLVLFTVFSDRDDHIFLFALSNSEKNVYGIALDSDPSCPLWLIDFGKSTLFATR